MQDYLVGNCSKRCSANPGGAPTTPKQRLTLVAVGLSLSTLSNRGRMRRERRAHRSRLSHRNSLRRPEGCRSDGRRTILRNFRSCPGRNPGAQGALGGARRKSGSAGRGGPAEPSRIGRSPRGRPTADSARHAFLAARQYRPFTAQPDGDCRRQSVRAQTILGSAHSRYAAAGRVCERLSRPQIRRRRHSQAQLA